jgi:hypothetical protein
MLRKFSKCFLFEYSLIRKNRYNINSWPFYSHFWSFFANYINIFQKSEVLTVILRCLTCLNHNLIKTMTKITNAFDSCNFQFWKKKKLKILVSEMPIFGHFFGTYVDIFQETEIQTVILRSILCLKFNWIKSYNIMLVKNIFFHASKCIISGLFCRSEF